VEEDHIILSADRAWQDQANCLGVDPDLFRRVKQKKCAAVVWFVVNALNTHWQTAKSLVSGADCLSANVVVCVASAHKQRATLQLRSFSR